MESCKFIAFPLRLEHRARTRRGGEWRMDGGRLSVHSEQEQSEIESARSRRRQHANLTWPALNVAEASCSDKNRRCQRVETEGAANKRLTAIAARLLQRTFRILASVRVGLSFFPILAQSQSPTKLKFLAKSRLTIAPRTNRARPPRVALSERENFEYPPVDSIGGERPSLILKALSKSLFFKERRG